MTNGGQDWRNGALTGLRKCGVPAAFGRTETSIVTTMAMACAYTCAATCDAKTHANAKAWLRHGLQALAGHAAHRGSGPDADEDDESLTLEQLLDAELRRTATSGGGGGGARPPALPQTVQQGSRHIPRKRLRAFSPLFPEPDSATATRLNTCLGSWPNTAQWEAELRRECALASF